MKRAALIGVAGAVLAAAGVALALRGSDDGGKASGSTAGPPQATTDGSTGTTTDGGPPSTSTGAPTPPIVPPPSALVTTTAAAAQAPRPESRPLLVGVVEDSVKLPTRALAGQRMRVLHGAGFRALRMTAIWTPGRTKPTRSELVPLRNAVEAARRSGIRVFLSVYQLNSATTPLTPSARSQFAAFATSLVRALPSIRDVIVGNEPNLNYFWMPQYTPRGRNAAAPAYGALLAETYDALKRVSPQIRVVGGALGPRGGDNPRAPRHTHSPTAFLRDLGKAYRASGRKQPLMDMLAFHPYLEVSRLPPSFAHPRTTTIALADYAKLVTILGEAFDGTAQRGSTLPIVYTEFGVQSRIPRAKREVYTNFASPEGGDAVDEGTQGEFYRQAFELAYCQPTVEAILLFLAFDEPDLSRWQSGVHYTDGTPKSSLETVREAAEAVREGSIAECDAD